MEAISEEGDIKELQVRTLQIPNLEELELNILIFCG